MTKNIQDLSGININIPHDLGAVALQEQLTTVLNEVLATEFTVTVDIINQLNNVIDLVLDKFAPVYTELCTLLSTETLSPLEKQRAPKLWATLQQHHVDITLLTGFVQEDRQGVVLPRLGPQGLMQMVEVAKVEHMRGWGSWVFWVILSLFSAALVATLGFMTDSTDAEYYTVFMLIQSAMAEDHPSLAIAFTHLFGPGGHPMPGPAAAVATRAATRAAPGAFPGLFRSRETGWWSQYLTIMLNNGLSTGITWLVTSYLGLPSSAATFVIPLLTATASWYGRGALESAIRLLLVHVGQPLFKFAVGTAVRGNVEAAMTQQQRRSIRQKSWVCRPQFGKCTHTILRTGSPVKKWDDRKACDSACMVTNLKLKKRNNRAALTT